MKHILATKTGWLIPVEPVSEYKWKDLYGSGIYVVTAEDIYQKVFSGEDSMDNAIEWIDAQ